MTGILFMLATHGDGFLWANTGMMAGGFRLAPARDCQPGDSESTAITILSGAMTLRMSLSGGAELATGSDSEDF